VRDKPLTYFGMPSCLPIKVMCDWLANPTQEMHIFNACGGLTAFGIRQSATNASLAERGALRCCSRSDAIDLYSSCFGRADWTDRALVSMKEWLVEEKWFLVGLVKWSIQFYPII